MNCIKCGRQIPDGELFCVECSLAPPSQEPEQLHRPVRAARAQEPDAAPKKAAKAKRPVGLIVTLVLALLLAVGEGAYLVYDFIQTDTRSAALTRANTELAQANARIVTLGDELTRAEEQHDADQLTIDGLKAQVDTLKLQLNSTAGSATQSQFDLSEQQTEYASLAEEFEALTERAAQLETDLESARDSLADAQAELSTANGTITSLRSENAGLAEKVSFFDTYAVFVTVSDPTYYHRYGCSEIGSKDYWIYNRKLAESKGSTACPICGG